jgi:hypothetical protein
MAETSANPSFENAYEMAEKARQNRLNLERQQRIKESIESIKPLKRIEKEGLTREQELRLAEADIVERGREMGEDVGAATRPKKVLDTTVKYAQGAAREAINIIRSPPRKVETRVFPEQPKRVSTLLSPMRFSSPGNKRTLSSYAFAPRQNTGKVLDFLGAKKPREERVGAFLLRKKETPLATVNRPANSRSFFSWLKPKLRTQQPKAKMHFFKTNLGVKL